MSKIIFINGTSSSGKTTLARTIQLLAEENWILFGIDALLQTMPIDFFQNSHYKGLLIKEEVINNEKIVTTTIGEVWKQLILTMPSIINAFLKSGYNLIIDEVITEDWVWEHYQNSFKNLNVCFIGLYCNLNVLNERERKRKDRMIGLAYGQYKIVHKNRKYHLFLDSSSESMDEIAKIILQFVNKSGNLETISN